MQVCDDMNAEKKEKAKNREGKIGKQKNERKKEKDGRVITPSIYANV
jgi:hypothetical protein